MSDRTNEKSSSADLADSVDSLLSDAANLLDASPTGLSDDPLNSLQSASAALMEIEEALEEFDGAPAEAIAGDSVALDPKSQLAEIDRALAASVDSWMDNSFRGSGSAAKVVRGTQPQVSTGFEAPPDPVPPPRQAKPAEAIAQPAASAPAMAIPRSTKAVIEEPVAIVQPLAPRYVPRPAAELSDSRDAVADTVAAATSEIVQDAQAASAIAAPLSEQASPSSLSNPAATAPPMNPPPPPLGAPAFVGRISNPAAQVDAFYEQSPATSRPSIALFAWIARAVMVMLDLLSLPVRLSPAPLRRTFNWVAITLLFWVPVVWALALWRNS